MTILHQEKNSHFCKLLGLASFSTEKKKKSYVFIFFTFESYTIKATFHIFQMNSNPSYVDVFWVTCIEGIWNIMKTVSPSVKHKH